MPTILHAQQSRLRQSVTRLGTQIARKMDANHRTRIAVMDFTDLDNNASLLGKYIAETLITDFFDSGKFQVVERRLLVKVLEENKLKATGIIDPATVKKIGQILGVDAIVVGTITEMANHVAVNARLVATDTAAVFGSASEEVEKDEDVRSIMPHAVNRPASETAPAAEASPTPQLAPINSVEQSELLIQIKSCSRRGSDRVVCWGSVTNRLRSVRRFGIYNGTNYTTLIDNYGNSYPANQATVGQNWAAELMPELPMNFFVAFPANEAAGARVNVVLVYMVDEGHPTKALFRNISVAPK